MIKFSYITLDQGVRIPAPTGAQKAGLQTSSQFRAQDGFEIVYDPTTGLITIERGGEGTTVHVHRMRECNVAPKVQPAKPPPAKAATP